MKALEAGDADTAEQILIAAEALKNPRVYTADDYDAALQQGNKYLADAMQQLMTRAPEAQQADDPYGAAMLALKDAPWYERALVGAGHRADQLWQGLETLGTYIGSPTAQAHWRGEFPKDEAAYNAAKRVSLQEADGATAKYRKDIEKNTGMAGVLGEFLPYYVSGAIGGPLFSNLTSEAFGGLKALSYMPITPTRRKAYELALKQRSLAPGLPISERLANILGMGELGLVEGGLDSEKNASVSGAQGLAGGVAAEMLRPLLSRAVPVNTQQDRDLLDWAKKNYGYQPTPGELTGIHSTGVYDAKMRIDAKTQDIMQNFDLHNDSALTDMMQDVLGMPKTGTLTKDAFKELEKQFAEGFDAIRNNTYGEFTPEQLHKLNMYAASIQNNPGYPEEITRLAEQYRRAMSSLSGLGGNLTATPISPETRKQVAKNLYGVLQRQLEKNQKAINASLRPHANDAAAEKLWNTQNELSQYRTDFLEGKVPFEKLPYAQKLWQQSNAHAAAYEDAFNKGANQDELLKLQQAADDADAMYKAAEAKYKNILSNSKKVHDATLNQYKSSKHAQGIAKAVRSRTLQEQLGALPYAQELEDQVFKAKQDYNAYLDKIGYQPTHAQQGDFDKQEKWVRSRLADINKLVGFNESIANQNFITPAHASKLDDHLMTIKAAGIDPSTKTDFYPDNFYEDVFSALAPIREGMRPLSPAGNAVIDGSKVDALNKELTQTIRDYYKRGNGSYAKALEPFKDYLNEATKWTPDTSPEMIDQLSKLRERYAMYDIVKDNRMINADMQVDPTAITKWAEGDKWELGSLLAGKAQDRPKEILQNMAYLHRYKLQMPRTNQTRNVGSIDIPADTIHTPWTSQPSFGTLLRSQLYLRGLPPIIPPGYPYITGLLNLPNRGLLSVQPWFHGTEQAQNFSGRTFDWASDMYDTTKNKYREFMKQ